MTTPKRLISFDPGLRMSGMAFFEDGLLVRAVLVRSAVKKERGIVAWLGMADATLEAVTEAGWLVKEYDFYTEYPQVYNPRFQKGDQADLIELAGVVGAVGQALQAETSVSWLPREWKGNINAEVMLARIDSRLSPSELAAYDPKIPASYRHNVTDSVGVGLHALGRLKQTRL